MIKEGSSFKETEREALLSQREGHTHAHVKSAYRGHTDKCTDVDSGNQTFFLCWGQKDNESKNNS